MRRSGVKMEMEMASRDHGGGEGREQSMEYNSAPNLRRRVFISRK
jgi:hypothetical protein